MTAPRIARRRLSPDEYRAARSEGYSDDEITQQGYDLPDGMAEPATDRPGFGRSVVGGLAQLGSNWGDEIAGGVAAAGAMLPGGRSPSEAYRATQGYVEDAADDFYRDHKKTAIAMQIGAGLAPIGAGVKAAKSLTAAPRLAKALLSAPGVGAFTGAVTGAGRGDSIGERVGNAGNDAMWGAGLGAGGSLLMRGLAAIGAKPAAALMRRMTPTGMGGPMTLAAAPSQDKALGLVAKKLLDDGVDPAAVQKAVASAQAGDPELLLNLGGQNTTGLARAIQSLPGRGATTMQSALDEQAAAVPELVGRGVEQAIGRKIPNAGARIEELGQEAADAARPLYKRLEGEVFGDEALQELLNRPSISKAMAEAKSNRADRGIRAPKFQAEHAPVETGAVAAAAPTAALKPGQSSRGLWMTAKTERGTLRQPETVETEGLIDDLLRREWLDTHYHYNVRKYGPTSAVTRKNQEMMGRIRGILEGRDGIEYEDLVSRLDERKAALDLPWGQAARLMPDDLNRMVHAPTIERKAVAPAAPKAPAAQAPTETASALFEELDNAKKLLDAQIDDLSDKVAKGIDKSVNSARLAAKAEARDALVSYLDEATAGGYEVARGAAAPGIRQREAFRSGTGALRKRADDLETELAGMSPDERARMLEGSATDIQERLTSRNPTNAASVFDPKARRNLDLITEGTPAQRTIRDTFERANKLNQQARASSMRGQSTTASTLQAQQDIADAVGPIGAVFNAGRKATSGRLLSLATDAVEFAFNKHRRGLTSNIAGEAADILTTKLGGPGNSALAKALVERALQEAQRRSGDQVRRIGAGSIGGQLSGGRR